MMRWLTNIRKDKKTRVLAAIKFTEQPLEWRDVPDEKISDDHTRSQYGSIWADDDVRDYSPFWDAFRNDPDPIPGAR